MVETRTLRTVAKRRHRTATPLVIAGLSALGLACTGSAGRAGGQGSTDAESRSSAAAVAAVAWSHHPPGGKKAEDVPQLVTVTFDDNFGLADPGASGGVRDVVDFFANKNNPAGTHNPENFDATPARATFYFTTIYLADEAKQVLGGMPGEDRGGRNRAAWTAAVQAGHEAGDHTVNHFNGGVVQADGADCCRARNWSVGQWSNEITAAKSDLTSPADGIGVGPDDVIGFRAPYLGYNDHLFTALEDLKFTYDTSLANCFDDAEDGGNCSWPYTLGDGSPDVEVLTRKFTTPGANPPLRFPALTSHPRLWEIPVTTLVVPPDEAAATYAFTAGLRRRISAHGTLPYPSLYEPKTGKITGLDYTLLMDAKITGAEMSAILKYNLDLHIAGNRAPLMFVGHSHLYAFSSAADNPDTPTREIRDERWNGLQDFINYALAKPEVRLVAAKDVVSWMARTSAEGRKHAAHPTT
jgi:peptidoglycan/xylan/chitin deacetylase (PgdA/CDA1 family)